MSFPLASAPVPTLTPYQFSYGGYTFGSGTSFRLTKIDGLDLPVVRSGDSGRPRQPGMFRGLDVLGQREITVQGDIGKDATSFGHSLQEARKALKPPADGVTEEPLWVNYPLIGTVCSMARVRKRAIPVDFTFVAGSLARGVTVLFVASDPKLYGATLEKTLVSAVPNSPWSFPLGFPTPAGTGGYYGTTTLTNAGEVETFPRILIEGPCLNPAVLSTTAGRAIAYAIEIPSGGMLELDTEAHTALYFSPGSSVGQAVSALMPGSEWWGLAPGSNSVEFSPGTGEATGQATFEYAPAYEL